jgi:lipid-binding SYLF domain-containing protein
MKLGAFVCVGILAAALFATACQTAPKSDSDKEMLEARVMDTVKLFKETDPSMEKFFDSAKGYAVFPSVGKGAVGVGGAYGRGMLIVDGDAIGYCDLSQGSIGFQLGGQTYREIVFFENDSTLTNFKAGQVAFAAQASAVAASAGASADANYEKGVAVFTMTKTGLMFEASIGGQKFDYEPK